MSMLEIVRTLGYDMDQRIDFMEIDFYINQTERWLDGTFDEFLKNRTREECALFEVKMGILHCKSLITSLTKGNEEK